MKFVATSEEMEKEVDVDSVRINNNWLYTGVEISGDESINGIRVNFTNNNSVTIQTDKTEKDVDYITFFTLSNENYNFEWKININNLPDTYDCNKVSLLFPCEISEMCVKALFDFMMIS